METPFAIVTSRFSRGSSYAGVPVVAGQVVRLGARNDAALLNGGYLEPCTKAFVESTFTKGEPPIKCRVACGGSFINQAAEESHYRQCHLPEIAAAERELAEARSKIAEADANVQAAGQAKAEAEDSIKALEEKLATLKGAAVKA